LNRLLKQERIRRMTILHRFYAVFPLILLLALAASILASCAAPGQGTWQGRQAASQQPAPSADPQPGVYPAPPSAAQTPMAAATGQQVRVAILLPLTGRHAAIGQSMLQAAQLALFDLGYEEFELMPRDTGGNASGAAQAAAAAMADGAQLILGPLFAEEVRAVKAATQTRGVNVIAFSTDWTLAGGNTFIMGFLPFEQVERIAAFAAQKGLRNAAVVSGADTYGTTVFQKFETEARTNGLMITRALSDPAAYDAVFIPAGGTELSNILRRVPDATAQKLGTGLWDDPRVASNPAMNGAWFAAPSPQARMAFEQRYEATYGTKPLRLASMAYDATALAAALARAGLASGRGPAFDAASLTSPSGFAGVDGIIRFTKGGLAERGMAVLAIQNGRIVEIDPAPPAFTR
jgi:ABC-type branched-subunit amino acid transport system substrate-binding protein